MTIELSHAIGMSCMAFGEEIEAAMNHVGISNKILELP
jgi:hypothetical protein